jgi:hypothetical protein
MGGRRGVGEAGGEARPHAVRPAGLGVPRREQLLRNPLRKPQRLAPAHAAHGRAAGLDEGRGRAAARGGAACRAARGCRCTWPAPRRWSATWSSSTRRSLDCPVVQPLRPASRQGGQGPARRLLDEAPPSLCWASRSVQARARARRVRAGRRRCSSRAGSARRAGRWRSRAAARCRLDRRPQRRLRLCPQLRQHLSACPDPGLGPGLATSAAACRADWPAAQPAPVDRGTR